MKNTVLVTALGIAIAAAGANSGIASTAQYMPICTEKAEHGGDEYGLTAWLDTRDKANEAGKAHELRTKGHRWRIAER